jgi:selenocysteine lyase/cysteine desulfurase
MSQQRALHTAQQEFAADGVYLNTASLGLPPRRVLDALGVALEDWRQGRSSPPLFDGAVEESRRLYASLVGVGPESVALGSQVSAFVGLVAANLPDGSEVVLAEGDFTSVVFPFLAQAARGVSVREVPLDQVADSVTDRTALVAVSSAQSADGRVADLDAISARAARTGARTLVDLTQSASWLPVDASRLDYTVCGGYKWLLAPRGTAFFTARGEAAAELIPHAANWYAGVDPWASIYGGPLRLAPTIRRFDLSPAWHCWVGQAPALRLLTEVGVEAMHAHNVGLTNRFREQVGLGKSDSAIVSLAVTADAADALAAAGIVAAMRAGRLRLSFHLYNTDADADRAAEALAPVVVREELVG